MDGEKWTVKEFAEKADITTQRVSQLMRKRLKQFVIEENGQKYILSSALPEVLQARKKQGYKAKSETVSETVSEIPETVSETLVKDFQAELDAVKAERDKLRQDLHALEITAAVSAAERNAARQHELEQAATIRALTESLHMAQEQCASLTAALSAAQSLHAGTLIEHRETAASVNQSDDLAKRDAVTVNQADVVKHDAPRPDMQKVHGVAKHHTPKTDMIDDKETTEKRQKGLFRFKLSSLFNRSFVKNNEKSRKIK